MFRVVGVQIGFDLGAFLSHVNRRDRNRNQLLCADNSQDENLQKILADTVRAIACVRTS
mgnify:CR=1 FL=1